MDIKEIQVTFMAMNGSDVYTKYYPIAYYGHGYIVAFSDILREAESGNKIVDIQIIRESESATEASEKENV